MEKLSQAIVTRQSDLDTTKESLEYADVCVKDLQASTSVLDNDTMLTARLWESAVSSTVGSHDAYYNRSFSSGRVAFTVPSNYFESITNRSVASSVALENVGAEVGKIEDYIRQQLKDGRSTTELNEKVRAAVVHKIHELKTSNPTK